MAASHLSAAFVFPPNQIQTIMSPPDGEDSGEVFDATPPTSGAEDGDESDNGAQFLPAPERWSTEQRNVLLLRVDDWKASKNVKSQQLVVQGALTDISSLPDAPPVEGLKLVSINDLFSYAPPLGHSVSKPGTDNMPANPRRRLSASSQCVTK